MAAARESQMRQQFTARNSSYLDHMAMPNLDKNSSLPYFPPYQCTTANAAFLGQYASDLPSLNAGQHSAVGGVRPPYCNIPYPTGDPYLKGSQCALPGGLGAVDKPPPVCAPQKRFLIFDQSENHTRLFFGPSFSPLDQIFASVTPASTNASLEKVANHVDQCILTKPVVEEKWDENHLSDGAGEMDEDTEEIDALLYSDSDDDREDDEVTSSGHSPLLCLDEPTEGVASSDDESPKRRRLLGGKYEKSSLESGGQPRGYKDDDDDVESRCAGDDDGVKKVKIREALKMLESIIPGLEECDPLSVIDGAVAYLKAMIPEAESLRRGGSGGE